MSRFLLVATDVAYDWREAVFVGNISSVPPDIVLSQRGQATWMCFDIHTISHEEVSRIFLNAVPMANLDKDIGQVTIPLGQTEILEKLREGGFEIVEIHILAAARQFI